MSPKNDYKHIRKAIIHEKLKKNPTLRKAHIQRGKMVVELGDEIESSVESDITSTSIPDDLISLNLGGKAPPSTSTAAETLLGLCGALLVRKHKLRPGVGLADACVSSHSMAPVEQHGMHVQPNIYAACCCVLCSIIAVPV